MMKRTICGAFLCLVFPWLLWAAPSPISSPSAAKTPTRLAVKKSVPKAEKAASPDMLPVAAQPEPTPDPLVVKARAESQRLRDVWDHSRLESTVFDKRYHRAYDRWVKVAKDGKAAAMRKRDQAMVELKVSLERRRLAWYEWELAKSKQVALEAQAKAKGLREDVQRVKKRIEDLGGTWKPTPTPTKVD